ncbi:unnamed protein product, partial [Didymodactylos carnosus]
VDDKSSTNHNDGDTTSKTLPHQLFLLRKNSTNNSTGNFCTMSEEPNFLSLLLPEDNRKKRDTDSIVRGILSNSLNYNPDNKQSDSSTSSALINDTNPPLPAHMNDDNSPAIQQIPCNPRGQIVPSLKDQQQNDPMKQHTEFLKKYHAAKTKLELQLQSIILQEKDSMNNGSMTELSKSKTTTVTKLLQLEQIKAKHMAKTFEPHRHSGQYTNNQDILNTTF